jgi:hypothetical protein
MVAKLFQDRARARLALLENLDRLAPGLLLTVVDLTQVERVAPHHPATRRFSTRL